MAYKYIIYAGAMQHNKFLSRYECSHYYYHINIINNKKKDRTGLRTLNNIAFLLPVLAQTQARFSLSLTFFLILLRTWSSIFEFCISHKVKNWLRLSSKSGIIVSDDHTTMIITIMAFGIVAIGAVNCKLCRESLIKNGLAEIVNFRRDKIGRGKLTPSFHFCKADEPLE